MGTIQADYDREKAVFSEHAPYCTTGEEGVSILKPSGCSDTDLIRLAADIRPSCRQLRFMERGLTGFIHFSVNTFMGNEWGSGAEDPNVFSPDELDTDEWVSTFRSAGITCITLVAKHHDGFCLWPSKLTDHCVKSVSWRNGTGDVVREFVDSCKKYGVSVGLYYSPWDRNAQTYGTEAYNDYMIGQLRELLTEYGPVDIIWFDGAGQDKSVSGTYMPFDWPRIYTAIRDCQPQILIDGGTDTRYVGNEAGQGRMTQWSVQSVDVEEEFEMSSAIHGLDLKAEDLGELPHLRNGRLLHWLPARGGTPTRAGWFWHEKTDHTVRSLKDAIAIYFSSVGHNSPLQYNIAPDNRGRVGDGEKVLFRQIGDYLRTLYDKNLAENGTVSADCRRDGVNTSSILNASPYDGWVAPEGVTLATVTLELPEKRKFNVIKLHENIKDYGQRISAFEIEVMGDDNEWKLVYEGTTIGNRRLIQIDTVHSDAVRLRIRNARKSPSLSNMALYFAPELLTPPDIIRDKGGMVSISSSSPNAAIRYTTDGSTPNESSDLYTIPFSMPQCAVLKARTFAEDEADYFNGSELCETTVEFGKSPIDWTVRADESTSPDSGPQNVLDPNPLTCWDTSRCHPDGKPPHEIVIDLGKVESVAGFSYLPAQRPYKGMLIPASEGLIRFYSFYVSDDPTEWGTPVSSGEFANVENNPVRQIVHTATPKSGRYIRFVAERMVNDMDHVRAAELQIFC